jgi:hypothetical protein
MTCRCAGDDQCGITAQRHLRVAGDHHKAHPPRRMIRDPVSLDRWYAQMASGGPRFLGVQYELDGIIHGLIANRDRRYVYGEVVYFKRWCVCVSSSAVRAIHRM